MRFTTFEDILAWQEARLLARLVRKISKKALLQRDWAWVDQMNRSALSVMSNIAEGSDAGSPKEFVKFLGYSKRSAAEVRSQLYYGLDEGYATKEEFEDAATRAKKIGSQVGKLMQYLRQYAKTRNPKQIRNP